MSCPTSERASCCCQCSCNNMPDVLDLRLHWSAVVGTPCCTDYDYAGALVEQVPPFTIPGTQPVCSGEIGRYYKGVISLGCSSPDRFDVEITCCPLAIGGGAGRTISIRVDGGQWHFADASSEDQCDCYWVFSGPSEVSDTSGNCANCAPQLTPAGVTYFVKCASESWRPSDTCP
jgi:hypothetical protein